MNPASGAMAGVLGSSRTMSSALDFKERANQNAANDRKLRNPNTPAERFVMPGQQQMQAQQQAQQRRIAPPQMNTFANMQKQGVARPAPPPVPANFVPSTGQGQQRPTGNAASMQNIMQGVKGALSFGGPGGLQIDQDRLNQLRAQTQAAMGQQQTASVTTGPTIQAAPTISPAPGQTTPMNPLSPEEQVLEDAYRARQAQEMARIEQQRLQFEQGQQTQQPQQTVRDRILTALGRPPVDAPAAQPAPVQTSVQPQEGMARLPMGKQPVLQRDAGMQRVAPAQPVIQRDAGQPAAPAAPATPAAPTLADRVRGRVGGKPKKPSAPATPQAQQPAQQQAPVEQPQQPVQPQQPQAQPDLQARLLEQLTGLTENASAYSTQDIQQMREAQRADIEAQFGAQRQQLEEELARRGISASSIAAGQLGDLAGQQARAIATAEAGLTEKAAESLQRGRETAIQGLAQAAGIQLEGRGLDLQSKKVQADIEAETKRLMQADRSLDLQQAQQQAQNSIARAQLAEQARSRVSQENISMARLQQDASQFADKLGLDRQQVEANISARTAEIAQRDRSLNLEEARWVATQEFEREKFEEQKLQSDRQFGRQTAQDEIQRLIAEAELAQLFAASAMPEAPAAPNIPGYGYGGRFTGSGGGRGLDDRGFE